MQQRTSLCRALIHDPDILLLDEPFGALDAFTREELWVVLQNLWLKKKCTVMLVTHDLAEATFLADTVHVVTKRPGHIHSTSAVGLSRPRTAFGDDFVAIVKSLREQIGHVRSV
jgi:NitT/TauT family transport system ATP-binding protein